MHQSLGARLRQRREEQHICLATIAEQTKIKASLLEELERDDISRWPVGIFRRSFIRGYAQAIGLDPAVVLDEFLTLHPDPPDVAAADPAEVTIEGARQHTKPPMRLRFLVGSALGSLARGREGAISTVTSALPASARPASAVNDLALPYPGLPDPAVPASALPDVALPDLALPDPGLADPAPTEPVTVLTPFEHDLLAVARLCTALSRVDQRSEMAPLLAEVADILDAIGLVIWVWDPRVGALRAVLTHGYPESLLSQLPPVRPSSDNATAAAFRSSETCIVAGSDRASGAVVVPLMTPGGCGGVLALEVPNGREQTGAVRGVATIFAAQLARWIRAERQADVPDRRLA
jgi:transcriptional regulator with XRE-family HTH domain